MKFAPLQSNSKAQKCLLPSQASLWIVILVTFPGIFRHSLRPFFGETLRAIGDVVMRKDIHFWLTTLIRGFIALLVGCFIMVIPDMARTLLLLPFALVIFVFGLAVYGVIDSTLILVSSFMVVSRRARAVLLAQGVIGVVVGMLFLFIAYDRVQPQWFLSLASLQSLSIGIGEIAIARHTAKHGIGIWNYTAGVIALCASAMYFVLRVHFAAMMNPDRISWFVYVYLVALGITQCLTAARMLYADRTALPGDGSLSL